MVELWRLLNLDSEPETETDGDGFSAGFSDKTPDEVFGFLGDARTTTLCVVEADKVVASVVVVVVVVDLRVVVLAVVVGLRVVVLAVVVGLLLMLLNFFSSSLITRPSKLEFFSLD